MSQPVPPPPLTTRSFLRYCRERPSFLECSALRSIPWEFMLNETRGAEESLAQGGGTMLLTKSHLQLRRSIPRAGLGRCWVPMAANAITVLRALSIRRVSG